MGQKHRQRNALAKKLINRLRRRHKVLAAFLPLKIGIHKDIWQRHKKLIRELAREVPGVTEKTINDEARELLSIALINHTRHPTYIKNMLAKKHRFTLDGEFAGNITDKDREIYRQRLKEKSQNRHAQSGSNSTVRTQAASKTKRQPKIMWRKKRRITSKE